jgi:hypothetical protein
LINTEKLLGIGENLPAFFNAPGISYHGKTEIFLLVGSLHKYVTEIPYRQKYSADYLTFEYILFSILKR